jgi:hypothetical protein
VNDICFRVSAGESVQLMSTTCIPETGDSVLTRVAVSIAGILLLQAPASALAQAHTRRAAVPPQILEHIWQDTAARSWFLGLPRDSLASSLYAEPIDLNGDSVPELVVRGRGSLCGASNCVFWIYGRTSSGYERLLDDGRSMQTLERMRTISHGYRDLRTWMHGSAWDGGVILYKFDGRRYRAAQCAGYSYSYLDAHDVRHELKRPRITPRPCPPED